VKTYEHFCGGAWQPPAKGRYLDSRNPFDGSLNGQFAEGDESDVDSAVAEGRRAFGSAGWAPPWERARILRRYADLIDESAERIAGIESRDNGKTLTEERQMYRGVGAYFRYAASLAETMTGDVPVAMDPNVLGLTSREPYGVVAIQTPWNTPGMLFAQPAASALAAGNTVVVKPSELAPLSTLELAALTHHAGFPAGVVNIVTGLGPVVGAALSSHPGTDQIVFIGSPAAGRIVAAQAAQHLAPAVLELGGKSANIVFADADLDRAAAGVAAGFTAAAGQSCVAGTRILVEASIEDEFVRRVVAHVEALRLGDPADPATDIGPICDLSQYQRIERYVDSGKAAGAHVVTGGRQPAELAGTLFFPPTVFTRVTPVDKVVREEIFGPVACVLPFTDEAEAVAMANDTEYGLAAGVWTRDLQWAHRVAHDLQAGTVWVNQYRRGDPAFTFGGAQPLDAVHAQVGVDDGADRGRRTRMVDGDAGPAQPSQHMLLSPRVRRIDGRAVDHRAERRLVGDLEHAQRALHRNQAVLLGRQVVVCDHRLRRGVGVAQCERPPAGRPSLPANQRDAVLTRTDHAADPRRCATDLVVRLVRVRRRAQVTDGLTHVGSQVAGPVQVVLGPRSVGRHPA
jgi:aldehyde dehydrogenase (NAD+)